MAQASFRRVSVCALALGFSILMPTGHLAQAAANEDSILLMQPPSPTYSAVSRARLNAFLDAVEEVVPKALKSFCPISTIRCCKRQPNGCC
jgi:soluble lytic murein transglycosylase